MERPYSGRAIFNEGFNGLEITIPSKRNWFILLFSSVWLCGWAFGEVMVTKTVFFSDTDIGANLFMLVWLVGWTVGGLFVFSMLVWTLVGKEVITLKPGEMMLERKAFFLGRSKTYSLQEAKDFKACPALQDAQAIRARQFNHPFSNNGAIQFDYGMKTIRFASDIDEAEAKSILQKLKDKRLLTAQQVP